MVQTFGRTNKCSGLWQSFFFFAERGGGDWLCSVSCHFSVLKGICLHLKGPPLLCEEFSGGGNFSFISCRFSPTALAASFESAK